MVWASIASSKKIFGMTSAFENETIITLFKINVTNFRLWEGLKNYKL